MNAPIKFSIVSTFPAKFSGITDTQITNDGTIIEVTLLAGDISIDLIRFIDPWGKALRYTYAAGDTFPLIESAGSDGDFDAAGDNITSQ